MIFQIRRPNGSRDSREAEFWALKATCSMTDVVLGELSAAMVSCQVPMWPSWFDWDPFLDSQLILVYPGVRQVFPFIHTLRFCLCKSYQENINCQTTHSIHSIRQLDQFPDWRINIPSGRSIFPVHPSTSCSIFATFFQSFHQRLDSAWHPCSSWLHPLWLFPILAGSYPFLLDVSPKLGEYSSLLT